MGILYTHTAPLSPSNNLALAKGWWCSVLGKMTADFWQKVTVGFMTKWPAGWWLRGRDHLRALCLYWVWYYLNLYNGAFKVHLTVTSCILFVNIWQCHWLVEAEKWNLHASKLASKYLTCSKPTVNSNIMVISP